MMRMLPGVLMLVVGVAAVAAEPEPVVVTVDTSEVPDLLEWGKKAKGLVETWHPKVAAMLASEGFTPTTKVKIVFKKDMKGVAYTRGTTIVIAADWVRKNPGDDGMVVHELCHAIQAYPASRAGWLVEGIADYVRFLHFEPKTKIRIDPKRSAYRDGYRTTAKFLGWVEKEHDKDIIKKLNAALRKGEYKDELFKTHTSKTLDELWTLFVASEERAK